MVSILIAVLVGSVSLVAAEYNPDVAILLRAIESSTSKANILSGKIDTLISRAEALVTALDAVDDNNLESSATENDQQDIMITEAKDRLDNLLDDLQSLGGRAPAAHAVAKLNNQRIKACWDQVDNLNSNNNLQDAQLAANDQAAMDLNSKVMDKISQLADVSTEKLDTLADKVDSLETLINSKKCFLTEVTVNLTNGIGTETVAFTSNFFTGVNGTTVVPVPYCGVTGVVSSIDESKAPSYGYGHHRSNREATGFTLDCSADTSGVTVTLIDRSQSEAGLDEVMSVSVTVKACSFSAQGNF